MEFPENTLEAVRALVFASMEESTEGILAELAELGHIN
jgi:hypothetical protein